jgi:competence protein ComEC
VYISHANLDHYSAVPTLLEEIPTGPIVLNSYFRSKSPPRSPSAHLLKLLEQRGHSVEVLESGEGRWTYGGANFELLAPDGPFDETLAVNDTSTVLRISYGGNSVLLTGDIEDRAQRALIERGNLQANVLLLPHHGSVRSSTASFIEKVGAAVLVRSSGQPTAQTMNGLPEIIGERELYNTADVGAVEIVLDGDGIRISCMLDP